MSQIALRRLTKEDAVKLSPQLSNLFVYMVPFQNRVLAVKKLLRDTSSKLYTFSDKLYTAITKLPKTSVSEPYMPVVLSNKDHVVEQYRILNLFQTAWQKYKHAQSNQLATQLAGILVDLLNDFITYQTISYRRLLTYRSQYRINRDDPIVNVSNESLENNLFVTNAPSSKVTTSVAAKYIQKNSTPYSGIYTQKCIDPVLFESQNIDLSTTILHILHDNKVIRTYCLDKESIKGYLGDMSMVFYQCRPEVKVGAIMIRPENVFPTQIRRLPFDFAVYVYESEILQIQSGKQYVLAPTEKSVGRIASHAVITGGNVVSAQHCQNDYSRDLIYTVKEVSDLPLPTEENRQKRIVAEIANAVATRVAERASSVRTNAVTRRNRRSKTRKNRS